MGVTGTLYKKKFCCVIKKCCFNGCYETMNKEEKNIKIHITCVYILLPGISIFQWLPTNISANRKLWTTKQSTYKYFMLYSIVNFKCGKQSLVL